MLNDLKNTLLMASSASGNRYDWVLILLFFVIAFKVVFWILDHIRNRSLHRINPVVMALLKHFGTGTNVVVEEIDDETDEFIVTTETETTVFRATYKDKRKKKYDLKEVERRAS